MRMPRYVERTTEIPNMLPHSLLWKAPLLCLMLQMLPPTLGTKTYVSPSRQWALTVKPSMEYGAGPSHVVALRADAKVWEKDEAFTLWDATIDDRGYVAGYAYTTGKAGFLGAGELVLVVLSNDGTELSRYSIDRKYGANDSLPWPLGLGAFKQAERGVFVVRTSDDQWDDLHEDWSVFSASTGERVEVARPLELLDRSKAICGSMAAIGIGGTPLTLAQWYCIDQAAGTVGVRFVLHDASWKPVWSHDLPRDYGARANEMWSVDSIFVTERPRQFILRFVAARALVTFEVAADANEPTGWKVREIGRETDVAFR